MSETIDSLGLLNLAALGFWIFMAVLAVVIGWVIIRKAQVRHETLTKIAEKGQNLDRDLIEKVLSPKPAHEKPDPIQQANQGIGFVFIVGFITIFAGLVMNDAINYPVVVLGIFAILLSFYSWRKLEKAEAAGKNEKKDREGLE